MHESEFEQSDGWNVYSLRSYPSIILAFDKQGMRKLKLVAAVSVLAWTVGCQTSGSNAQEALDSEVNRTVNQFEVESRRNQFVFSEESIDQIPTPIHRSAPTYPSLAKKEQVEGVVHLEFIVEKNGTVQEVVTASGTNEDFVRASIEAVKGWRFSPGILDGKPVRTIVIQRLNFRL